MATDNQPVASLASIAPALGLRAGEMALSFGRRCPEEEDRKEVFAREEVIKTRTETKLLSDKRGR
jgi:hypothetical protein